MAGIRTLPLGSIAHRNRLIFSCVRDQRHPFVCVALFPPALAAERTCQPHYA